MVRYDKGHVYPPEYDHEPPDTTTCQYCSCDNGEEVRCDECEECHPQFF